MKYLTLVFVAALSSCTTYQIVPTSDRDHEGFSYLQRESLSIKARTISDGRYEQIFDVVVENVGNKNAMVGPSNLRLEGAGLKDGPQVAINPSLEIADKERELAEKRSELNGMEGGFLGAVYGVILAFDQSEKGKKEREERDRDRQQREIDLKNRIVYLSSEINELEKRYLNTATLGPGQTISGYVKFRGKLQKGDLTLKFQDALTSGLATYVVEEH